MDFLLGKVNFHGHVSLLEGIMFFPMYVESSYLPGEDEEHPFGRVHQETLRRSGLSGVRETIKTGSWSLTTKPDEIIQSGGPKPVIYN